MASASSSKMASVHPGREIKLYESPWQSWHVLYRKNERSLYREKKESRCFCLSGTHLQPLPEDHLVHVPDKAKQASLMALTLASSGGNPNISWKMVLFVEVFRIIKSVQKCYCPQLILRNWPFENGWCETISLSRVWSPKQNADLALKTDKKRRFLCQSSKQFICLKWNKTTFVVVEFHMFSWQ